MKISAVVGVVIGVHCMAIGCMVLIPGCRKSVPIEEDTAVVMPPVAPSLTAPIVHQPRVSMPRALTAVPAQTQVTGS